MWSLHLLIVQWIGFLQLQTDLGAFAKKYGFAAKQAAQDVNVAFWRTFTNALTPRWKHGHLATAPELFPSDIQFADVALTSQNQHADKGCPDVYGISEQELIKSQPPVTMSNTLHGSFVVGSETLQKWSTPKIANAALTPRRRGVKAITRAQQVAQVERPALQQSTPKKVSPQISRYYPQNHFESWARLMLLYLGTEKLSAVLITSCICRPMSRQAHRSSRHRYDLPALARMKALLYHIVSQSPVLLSWQ